LINYGKDGGDSNENVREFLREQVIFKGWRNSDEKAWEFQGV